MTYFDKMPKRWKTNSIKWNKDAIENLSSNRDARPFWVADMDFYSAPAIIKKAEEVAHSGVYGYPSFTNLIPTFKDWLKRKHNWLVDENNIAFSMGLLHGLALSIDIFTKEGDGIIIPTPCYRPFRELCSLSNRKIIELPLSYDKETSSFSFCLDELEEKAKNAKLLLFCSPHNPTGIVFKENELKGLLEIAKKNSLLVLSDEIHSDLVHSDLRHIPMGKANESVKAKCITFMAPSKTFNIAGEHSAFAIFSDKETKDKWTKKEKALWLTEPGYFVGEMISTCYTSCDEYNKKLCKYLKDNYDYISSFFEENKLGIKAVKSNASFVVFLDCAKIYPRIKEKMNDESENILSHFFGKYAFVAVNDGTWFGKEYYTFVRFNYGTNREEIKSALERIKKAIESL